MPVNPLQYSLCIKLTNKKQSDIRLFFTCSATGDRTQDPLVTVPFLFQGRLDYVITHAVNLENSKSMRVRSASRPRHTSGKVLPKGDSL